jgi:hypothetical protein
VVGRRATPRPFRGAASLISSGRIGALRPNIREDGTDAGIFVTPIKAGPRQQLRCSFAASVDRRNTSVPQTLAPDGEF